MTDITYPPELLPAPDLDDEVEITVCAGPPKCDGSRAVPCPECVVFELET